MCKKCFSVLVKQYVRYNTKYIIYIIMLKSNCMRVVQCTLYNVQCLPYGALCICIIYNLHIIQCLYNIHSNVHNVYHYTIKIQT